MRNEIDIGLWATAHYRDGEAALAWLKAIGFTEHAVYRNTETPAVIEHAELLWPYGGGIMIGSHRPDNEEWPAQPGTSAMYLVTDDAEGLHAAALAAGGTEIGPVIDKDYGGSGGEVRDPEGNLWSFGTYRPGVTAPSAIEHDRVHCDSLSRSPTSAHSASLSRVLLRV